MMMIFAVVLLVLWLIGLVTGSTFGGLVHILLVVAIILVAWRIYQTRLIK